MSIREALIRAAQEILVEQGREVAVLAIAERAGVSTGSFYNNFESKDELFTEATNEAVQEFQGYTRAAAQGLSPLEGFVVHMRLFGRMPESHPQFARLLVRTAPETLARGQDSSVVSRVHQLFADGELRAEDPELAVLVAIAAFERLLAIRLHDSSVPPERADDLAYQMLLLCGVSKAKAKKLVSAPLPGEALGRRRSDRS